MLSERKFKSFLFSLLFLFSIQAKGQIFSFADTSTTLVKNTNQSPAHWYLEITNNCGVDTTMRWKSHFENVPSEWVINFDSQNQNWPVVMDGDSSDFVMTVNPDFPQKLIIGAMLNDTPGHGVVYFDIYDPANRTEVQTISYEFIVSLAGLNALEELPWLEVKNGMVVIKDGIPTQVDLFDLNSKLILSTNNQEILLQKDQVFFIRFTRENKVYQIKLVSQ